jgi:undecaprenyl-diphosphatase
MAVKDVIEAPDHANWGPTLLAVIVSAITGYFTIHFLLKFIARVGMLPFMIYRLVIAAIVVAVFA